MEQLGLGTVHRKGRECVPAGRDRCQRQDTA